MRLSVPPDGKWGGKNEDGVTWNGVVGELQKRAVDFTHPLSLNIERSRVMEYSIGVIFDKRTLIIPKPSGSRPSVWGFIVIFNWMTWVLISLIILIVGFNLWIRYLK